MTPPIPEPAPTGGNRLLETVVELADTLVDDFDTIAFLQVLVDRCVELLEVDAAGLLLADHHGRLRLVASSSEQVRLLELLQLQNDEGPCLEAFRTGTRMSHPQLSTAGTTWPTFVVSAAEAGFEAVDALPMKLRDEVVGALPKRSSTSPPSDCSSNAPSGSGTFSPNSFRQRSTAGYSSSRPKECSPNASASTWTALSPRCGTTCVVTN
ncbi:GAF domain-containing protein [Amycolatopsis sp. NPDC049159]|uniref:GAF domain-containing protein n=1 Tax=Amycolatopsis sp. NPDC049159 TaxID=3157210 RepID=UPI003408FD5A